MILIVLASGRGSRLKKITSKKPKCLIKIFNNTTLLDFISGYFSLFKQVIVVTGYKSKLIESRLNNYKVKFVYNKNYLKTNMVESLMLTKKNIKNQDVIMIYSDIFFDKKILESLFKFKNNVIPLNSKWLKLWKKRFNTLSKIKEDAEDVKVSKNKILSIGNKIKKKIPKYQYMGILKLNNETYKKLSNFYKKLKNKKISMTNFLESSIIHKIAKYNYIPLNYFWYEVDNTKDLNVLKKDCKKNFQ